MDFRLALMASLVSALVAGLPEWLHPALRALLLSTLKLGPLPAHIAFIMDGNRRHALNHAQPLQVAHEQGFEALKRILESFLELRVKCVTVFAFSLENFNRDQAEVEGLMALARSRLVEICEKGYVVVEPDSGLTRPARFWISTASRFEFSGDEICSRSTCRPRAPVQRSSQRETRSASTVNCPSCAR